jgi:hypothetical protein
MKNNAAIKSPKYYNMGKIEAIEVIEDWNLDFNLGNVIKYVSRAPYKNDELQDLLKAKWYLNRKIKSLKKSKNKTCNKTSH